MHLRSNGLEDLPLRRKHYLQKMKLQAQAEQAQSEQTSDTPEFLKDNALHNVSDEQALMKEVENLNTLIEWAEDGLDNEVQYDDDGNEYMLKDGDKTYTKNDCGE